MSDSDPNFVVYSIGANGPVFPDEKLPSLPPIPHGSVVVIEGRREPAWRYSMALNRLHGSAAFAVAIFDIQLGAVVVKSHNPAYHEGQVFDFQLPA